MTCYGIHQVAQHVLCETPLVSLKTIQWFLRTHQNPKVHYDNILSNLAVNGMFCISSESALHGDLKSALSLFVSFLVFEL